MQLNDVAATVSGFIRDRFMIGRPTDSLGVSDSLLEKGIIDSTGVLELVEYLEERFSIKVDDEELTPDNLETIQNISNFVIRKKDGLS